MMAEAADVQYVKDCIERDHESHGWAETDIVSRLDNGQLRDRVVEAYWRQRATDTILLVNTSEAGSSRGNDAIYSRMVAAAETYAKKAEAIESAPGATTEATLGSIDMERA